jgi:hypothetical protein
MSMSMSEIRSITTGMEEWAETRKKTEQKALSILLAGQSEAEAFASVTTGTQKHIPRCKKMKT